MEDWITEQERMVTQSNTETELPFLIHQINKFSEFEGELTEMEPQLTTVNQNAGDVIDKGHSKEVFV